MMDVAPLTLLTFDLGDTLYGVDAAHVRETIWLPELTPIEEAPPYIVGMFSLRGQIVPVTDLFLRFGHPARSYSLTDQIVVLEQDQSMMGLIVSKVREVITVEGGIGNAECGMILQSDSLQSALSNQHSSFDMVRVGDDLVTLLDARQLLHLSSPPPQPSPALRAGEGALLLPPLGGEGWDGGKHFCPQATPEQHAVFRDRARALMDAVAEEEGAHLQLAVVELGGEYFGIALEAVQEFCDIVQPTPIPCCPPHILGAISLRGKLLTLFDLHAALHLPRTAQNGGKAVIARFGEQAVGVAVDEVHDVVYLREAALQVAPQSLSEHAEVSGTAPYAGRMMTVLDLPALLAREEWIVNEQC